MNNKIDQYTNTDDEKLFALIEQGDERAFTQAYERYHKLLYVLAYRYLMSSDMAEDVVQHVFTRLVGIPLGITCGNQLEKLPLYNDEKSCPEPDSQ